MSTRRLAAIMFADIVGYTAMMQENEDVGLVKVQRFSKVVDEQVKIHDGEILQFLGDGCLCIFQSAVEAMHAARAIQQTLKADPKVPLRIGIHIGDIVIKDGNIYGDGVNLASRVESMGVPGSILVTERVIHDVKSHPEFEMASLGKFQFKNVTKPLEVFALASEGFPVPKKGEIQGKLEKKPAPFPYQWITIGVVVLGILAGFWFYSGGKRTSSIEQVNQNSVAVLPFNNMNKDEEGELFCDGMMEDILNNLSRIENLKVISRTSAMHYKKTTKKVPEIASELGVAHIVEGSVRKYGNKARINVQLIRAEDDHHVWAETYDRSLEDIFEVQSEVAQKIVTALRVNITAAESKTLERSITANPQAYQLFLKGKRATDSRTREGLAQSVKQLEEALELDPDFAEAHAQLAFSTFLQGRYGFTDKDSSNDAAKRIAKKALSLDDQNALANDVMGGIYHVEGKLERSKKMREKSLRLNPNSSLPHHASGQFYASVGDYEREVIHRKKAVELDPLLMVYHENYITALTNLNELKQAREELEKAEKLFPERADQLVRLHGQIAMQEERYHEAIPYLEKAVKVRPHLLDQLAYAYAQAGEPEKAKSILDSLQKEDSEKDYTGMATIYAGLNNPDSALHYIQLSIQRPDLEGIDKLKIKSYLIHDKNMETLRKDPRFGKIVKKLD